MSRTLFENSKAALAFAGMTIIGAVLMVGTQDQGGVLDRTVEQLVEKRASAVNEDAPRPEATAEILLESEPGEGWGGSRENVFGEYNPGNDVSTGVVHRNADEISAYPGAPPARIPGPQPVVADNPGELPVH